MLQVSQFRAANRRVEDFISVNTDLVFQNETDFPLTRYPGMNFTDQKLVLSDAPLEPNMTYYLSCYITLQTYAQSGEIILRNSTTQRIQTINTFSTPMKTSNTESGVNEFLIDLSLTPNDVYDEIIFHKTRDYEDYRAVDDYEIIQGHTLDINTPKLFKVNYITLDNGTRPIIKLGIQGQAGQKFIIDGVENQLGRTGVFELNNGYEIKKLQFIPMIAADERHIVPFIVDYCWEAK